MKNSYISQQGDLDSACLLYTIANCYKALTNKNIGNKWENIIRVIPSIHQFFTSGSGISDKDSIDQIIHESVLNISFKQLETPSQLFHFEKIELEEIEITKFNNSVVIICFDRLSDICKYPNEIDHWIPIVGKDNSDFLLACSATRNLLKEKYKEFPIANSKRKYNNTISLKKILKRDCILKKYIYKVSKN